MIGLIITGHGQFATGLLSAAEVIAGKQEGVVAIDFLSGDSSEELYEKIAAAVPAMQCESIVFMTDIAGGTPFNQSVLNAGKLQCDYRILSGTNMPVLLGAIFGRATGDIAEMVEVLLNSEQSKVQLYAEKKKERSAKGSGGI